MYASVRACMHACVHVCVYVCAGRDIIFDKTMYMHREDSDKLVYLSSLISLHLRYMGNENNTSFKLLVTSHQIGQTNCYAYIVLLLLLLLLLLYLEMICPGDCCNLKT